MCETCQELAVEFCSFESKKKKKKGRQDNCAISGGNRAAWFFNVCCSTSPGQVWLRQHLVSPCLHLKKQNVQLVITNSFLRFPDACQIDHSRGLIYKDDPKRKCSTISERFIEMSVCTKNIPKCIFYKSS